MTENADVSSEAEPTAAAAARDQLLYAIADEAVRVARDQAGNASAALVELARAYALVTARSLEDFPLTEWNVDPYPNGIQDLPQALKDSLRDK